MNLAPCSRIEPGTDLAVVRQGLAPARPSTKPKPGKTTDAALQYLLTSEAKAWNHLIEILMVAKR
jgi:hypothetical protein